MEIGTVITCLITDIICLDLDSPMLNVKKEQEEKKMVEERRLLDKTIAIRILR